MKINHDIVKHMIMNTKQNKHARMDVKYSRNLFIAI